ncbi:putative dipeptide-transport integral membrane protein ABC transporter DppB [Sphaerisporangium krabiense]|uniref:Peptide/nickel transport system permease protein/oligopeptide transport system permease protein n=1 Tax=Sphaerisporangium krabiense TaxID=763782 RepID=A0A7W9DSX9_9ACTN|nr:ABC transporter permease [Sphaerisporangium krabiense]MBB5629589.1 peptide/nickel transport system permease protein/oligopeptide transport system permease protein [Sphaerisporangium krabiense]GII67247.1 putative dipeptide-transport integral membrane protein ABC transporter DppB [Sphaerisporangium krabiense]
MRYALTRLLQAVPVFVATTFLIYFMVWSLPGDPIVALAGDKPLPESVLRSLREHYHLDEPLIVQYGLYMAGVFLRGDLGETFTGQPVGELLQDRWAVTAQLALTAWVFELVVGIALGVVAGLRRGRLADTAVLAGTTFVIAVPVFVVGYTAQIVLGLNLGLFPTAGTDQGWPGSYLLPGMVLGSFGLAYVARLTRTSVVENLRADYVRTATAKGLRRSRVIGRHALRNSLIPVVTYLGVDFGNLMAGAVVTEGIFNLPGIGQQVFQSIQLQEGPVVVGVTTLLVMIFILANLLVDLLYGVLDPRIRRG